MSKEGIVKVQEVEAAVEKKLVTLFQGSKRTYAYFGEDKYFIPKAYKNHADGIRGMPLREDDVWVATFPRSGTTWTQEMVWLINNKLNYEKAADSRLIQRYVFLEFKSILSQDVIDQIYTSQATSHDLLVDYKALVNAPSPRYFKTHLPLSLLPPNLLDTARVVYVARDPRDVAVSYYHHNRLFKVFGFAGDFKDYWEFFRNSLVENAPFFAHVKEAWARRNHPNMLFLFYEEMYKDLPAVVRRVAKFFEKQYSDEQFAELCEHLRFDKMKHNESVHPQSMRQSADVDQKESFFRKGKSGGWRDYFDDKMAEEAKDWISDNLQNTDLRFPEV